MSASSWQNSVVPARLSFLAIYNPSLGLTDDTFADQLVFWHSRQAHEARLDARKNARKDAAGGDALREEENEKLRQIGLAQGMVDFARSFADDHAVDSIDTEKSRIVLHELEKGWWILASIDLTRLPTLSNSSTESSKKGSDKTASKPAVEYSAREVSPPSLLLAQLLQAHYVFTLHHGPSLTELFLKLPRDGFYRILDRFWTRFSRTWDVLLHGNPAADIFSGLKLSSGGELGMGVGEEEWGSGERDVLEDLTRRTEGLVDLVVSRFGEPAPPKEEAALDEEEALPWLGSGHYPIASDGIIFGGINAISRPSLRNVSLWMRHIYTYGDYAYGVRDNPHRERRKRRKRNPPIFEPEPDQEGEEGVTTPRASRDISAHDYAPKPKENGKTKPHRSVQSSESVPVAKTSPESSEHRPGIPPPIVSAAQQSLENATKGVKSGSPRDQGQEKPDDGTTWGVPDQYMKYLTLGLSTLAKPSAQNRPDAPRRTSTSSSKTIKAHRAVATRLKKHEEIAESDEDPPMSQMDPMPEGQTLKDRITIQKHQEEKGHFLVGLKGNLDDIPEDPEADIDEGDEDGTGLRNVLRTVQVEIIPAEGERTKLQQTTDDAGLEPATDDRLNFKRLRVLVYVRRPFIYCFLFEDRTSMLSIARFYKDLHDNLTPIHKPLLESTSVSRIAQRIEESQAQASASNSDTASIASGGKSQKTPEPKVIYDLIWDPALLTVHTSIPNIAEPGTPAAEGLVTSKKDNRLSQAPDWTRIEALNVHSQIINTLASTRKNTHEYERTSKTSRGWWVVWMKLPPSKTRETAAEEAESRQRVAKEKGEASGLEELNSIAKICSVDSDETFKASTWLESQATTPKDKQPTNRIAFLVRKASDTAPVVKASTTSRAASSMWQSLSLRSGTTADESTGGASAGWGPAALAGGIGFDARKYVDGLLQLNR